MKRQEIDTVRNRAMGHQCTGDNRYDEEKSYKYTQNPEHRYDTSAWVSLALVVVAHWVPRGGGTHPLMFYLLMIFSFVSI